MNEVQDHVGSYQIILTPDGFLFIGFQSFVCIADNVLHNVPLKFEVKGSHISLVQAK